MHSFADTEGRTWSLELTIGAVKRVQALLDVNLLDPLGAAEEAVEATGDAPKKKEVPLITRLQLDVVLLVDVIFALLKPQADGAGISDEQFASALGGDTAYRAFEAFMGEWRDFFQKLRRQTEAQAIAANMELVAAEDQRNLAMIDRVTEAAVAAGERERQKAMKRIEALGRSPIVTGSGESPASTPPD